MGEMMAEHQRTGMQKVDSNDCNQDRKLKELSATEGV